MSDHSYRDLKVWQEAVKMTTACYRLTKHFPTDDPLSLGVQLRRAAAAVPYTIAEGAHRIARGDYFQCLGIAKGARTEYETQLALARHCSFISESVYQTQLRHLDKIGRLLDGLCQALQRQQREQHPKNPAD